MKRRLCHRKDQASFTIWFGGILLKV